MKSFFVVAKSATVMYFITLAILLQSDCWFVSFVAYSSRILIRHSGSLCVKPSNGALLTAHPTLCLTICVYGWPLVCKELKYVPYFHFSLPLFLIFFSHLIFMN